MGKIDLSIIIVNYNTKKLLEKLLISLKNSDLRRYKAQIIIIDNASNNNIKNAYQTANVDLIQNKKNLGYARANNQGIGIAKGKYILLLNPDTLMNKTSLIQMIEFMEKNRNFAAATCRVELANGKIDPASHRGFPTPWAAFTYFSGLEKIFPQSPFFGQYHQTWRDLKKVHEVEVISGAFFMIRKSILKKVGLLDERFFMYAEDIDLCYRIRKKGYKIGYNPEAKIIHYKHSSGKRRAPRHFFETMKLFYDKHYRDKYPWIIREIVLLGIWLASKFKN
jgi:GT2 family glycosyltransferase